MSDYDMSESDYIEDVSDFLEESKCEPCDDCKKMSCSDFCARYDEWFWDKWR